MSSISSPADQLKKIQEIAELVKKFQPRARKIDPIPVRPPELDRPAVNDTPPSPAPRNKSRFIEAGESLFDNPQSVKPTGEPLRFPSPLHLLRVIAPDMIPHAWQAEEMLRLGGFVDPYDLTTHVEFTKENPLLYCLPACNGSGKDQYVISSFLVWFAVCGLRNRGICTSSSFEQVKNQTEPGVIELIERCNKIFGRIFHSREFHHICTLTGGEIKMFATDEPKYAEGYHPWGNGKMALLMNEAKSIGEDIFAALTRCTGYSHWLMISSPGGKSGRFYRDATRAIKYPAIPKPNQYFTRHISAYDCPHIPRSHIERQIIEMPSWWVDSSINALFSDVDDSTIIPTHFVEELRASLPSPSGNDIGIGLDTAAGVDENSLYVRQGNRVIHEYHFRQKDTTQTAEAIDSELLPWKTGAYIFNADDGGVSHAITDNLVKLGWRINRCHNQSPATDKRRFLNLGIQMWWKTRVQIIRKEIHHKFYNPTTNQGDHKLFEQLTTRRCDGQESAQGRLKIEPKSDHKSRMGESPDRADAFVLCFFSRRSVYFDDIKKPEAAKASRFTSKAAFVEAYSWGNIDEKPRKSNGNYTQQNVRL